MLKRRCSDERIGKLERMAVEVVLDERDGARGDGFGDGQEGCATLVKICLEQFEFALVAHALHELYRLFYPPIPRQRGLQPTKSHNAGLCALGARHGRPGSAPSVRPAARIICTM